MKKIIIVSVAVIGSLVGGEALMGMVFAFVMVSGLMVGCFMNTSTRPLVECPSRVFRLVPRKRRGIPDQG